VALYHNNIVWVKGPFPAGENDKAIFDKPGGLASKLKEGQVMVADNGYSGTNGKCATRNKFDSAEVKDIKERGKAREETINSRLKTFGILNENFRTTGAKRLDRHKVAMEACLVIIQYELENGNGLFTV